MSKHELRCPKHRIAAVVYVSYSRSILAGLVSSYARLNSPLPLLSIVGGDKILIDRRQLRCVAALTTSVRYNAPLAAVWSRTHTASGGQARGIYNDITSGGRLVRNRS